MKKITILLAMLTVGFTAMAGFKPLVTNDPANDAGTGGIDVKNLSYEISTDNKYITFMVETHQIVQSWNNSGFMIYCDDDLDPTSGMTPACDNKSMKADRSVMIMNMSGNWGAYLEGADQSINSDITSMVTVTPAGPLTMVKIPLSAIDGDEDGKFNMIFATAVLTGSSSFSFDDVPNTAYVPMDVFASSTGIASVNRSQSVTAYPNPSSSQVIFTSTEVVNGQISILDVTGKVVVKEIFNGNTNAVSVSSLNNGIYMFRLTGNDNVTLSYGRLVVQH